MSRRSKTALILAGLALLMMQRSFLYYGLTTRKQLNDHIAAVVEEIGGGVAAENLLIETASAETNIGKTLDRTWMAGIGIMQFDRIGFDDVKMRTPQRLKMKVLQRFGVDIDRAEHTDLRYSPLLSVIFARLKYRLIPDPIPQTLEERGLYWKKHYNSYAGKGTVDHYITAAVRNGLA